MAVHLMGTRKKHIPKWQWIDIWQQEERGFQKGFHDGFDGQAVDVEAIGDGHSAFTRGYRRGYDQGREKRRVRGGE